LGGGLASCFDLNFGFAHLSSWPENERSHVFGVASF